MPEPIDLPRWKKEDLVHIVGNAYYREKKKKKIRIATKWKQVGSGRDFIFKRAQDGRSMLIIFGGVHPKMYNFSGRNDENRFLRELLRQTGHKGDRTGRWFYVGK